MKTLNIIAQTLFQGVLVLQFTVAAAQGASKTDVKNDESIRPFRVYFSNADLKNLRQRILETRWPEKETVTDQSQGVPLATVQKLAHYWATDYNWRKIEAKLNTLPQFMTKIDGLNIHMSCVPGRMVLPCRHKKHISGFKC
jgi:hypothetical protein